MNTASRQPSSGALALGVAAVLAVATASAEDWPTYLHDSARSGVSGETLALPLTTLWTYVPPAEPPRAWADPQPAWPELPKLDFDSAFHVALAGDAVFFGSSVDNGVHALDAATGARRWTLFTGGAVRLAPTVSGGRVYAGSDDGAVYCADARDGSLAWRARPFPAARRILGAGRLMSLWPVRTGVLVDGGAAYCGAGIFPAVGTAVCAFEAGSGRMLWRTSGVPREAYVMLSPQGYLLASDRQLYVPCGRATPIRFARADGAVLGALIKDYDVVGAKGVISGGYGVLVGSNRFFVGSQNVLHGYGPEGEHVATLRDTRQLVVTPDRFFRLTGLPLRSAAAGPGTNKVIAVNRAAQGGKENWSAVSKDAVLWSFAGQSLQTIAVAGRHVVVGTDREVILLEGETGRQVWSAPVDGVARGLAVANGRLVVSTDRGRIHAFGQGTPAPSAASRAATPFPMGAAGDRTAALAEAIAKDSGMSRGHGLVIGEDGAQLALALARRTGLLVHVAETDAARADTAREALLRSGDYGVKVVIDAVPADGTNSLPYPPYFANVIVADATALGCRAATPRELLRLLKPCGGILYAGPGPMPAAACAGLGVLSLATSVSSNWTRLVRGRLPGVGDWTHQYADAGNSGSSDDERVRGRTEVLWYGEPGPDKMPDRHRGNEAPLLLDGRVFAQGLRVLEGTPILMSFDAYNGVPYWERELAGAQRLDIRPDCGNLACSPEGLFVAAGSTCAQLDLLTGETRATYRVPTAGRKTLSPGSAGAGPASPAGLPSAPSPPGEGPSHSSPSPPGGESRGEGESSRSDPSSDAWAYVAADRGMLVGSESSAYQFSRSVFAYDLRTGRLAWRYGGDVIRNATLAVSSGRVFLVEHRGQKKPPRILTALEKAKADAARRKGLVAAPPERPSDGEPEPAPPRATNGMVRTVVALDLLTGREVWARDVDLTACGSWTGGLCLMVKDGVVILCGVYTAYGKPPPDVAQRRAMALSAADGSTLWNEPLGNLVRPVLVKDRLITRPRAFDLKTGRPLTRTVAGRTTPWRIMPLGACGQMSASAHSLFYRYGNTMMMDADTGSALMSFVGMRPGCLINIIPAGGVVVQVEASSGCTCGHAIQSTIAFAPAGAE